MEIALHVHVVQHIWSNISGYTEPCNLFTIWKLCMYRSWISQGTVPWQPNHLWTSGTTWPKKLAYFVKYFRIFWTYFRNLCTIWKLFTYRWMICTFFPNLVNFRPVISEFMLLKRAIFEPCTRNFRTIFIRHVGVSKWFEDRHFDFSRVIGIHFCTPYRNLVRFGLWTPEFKT